MTKKVLLLPSDDRTGNCALTYFYNKIGYKVLIPKHGSKYLNWKKIATWPTLLCKAEEDKTKRNIEIHGFENRTDENTFGEDLFLIMENLPESLYQDDISCQIVDLEKDKIDDIDIFHTLRGANLSSAFDFAKNYCPKAKWISSTVSHYNHYENGIKPINACLFLPANYENVFDTINHFKIRAVPPFDFDLLGVKQFNGPKQDYASFQHNFEIREPNNFKFYSKLNEILDPFNIRITNYGGNERGAGAAIKYSLGGPSGTQYPTISPRSAADLTQKLKSVLILKGQDWGGGVLYYSLMAGAPIITIKDYVNNSNAYSTIIDGYNSLIVNSPEEAAQMILELENNYSLVEILSKNMKEKYKELFNENHINKFNTFIERALND